MQCSQCLCMLTPRRYPPPLECYVWSSSWLFNFSGGSPCVSSITVCYTDIPRPLWKFETLFLLCDNWTHLLYFSYRPQCSSAVNRLHEHLHPSQRLFTSSVSHPVVSSSPLTEPINSFWQLQCIVLQLPFDLVQIHLHRWIESMGSCIYFGILVFLWPSVSTLHFAISEIPI